MTLVLLLGDSVFDNGAYVPAQPDVRRQVQALMPADATDELLARDGASIRDVEAQLCRIPAGATHLLVSAGGNDAIQASGLLNESAASMAGAKTGRGS
jgi:hypothetical protein